MIEAVVLAAMLVLMRVASFVAFLPPFSSGGLPKSIKIGLAVALTGIWAPLHGPALLPQVTSASASPQAACLIGWLAIREVVIGAGLAWLLGLIFVPMRVAGAYIAQEMGLTLASLASPIDQQSSNVVSQFIEALGTLLFFAVDAHHLLFRMFAACLDLFPLGQAFSLPDREWFVRAVAGAEQAGLELAAPVGAGLFLTLVLMLFVMRTAPQFNLLSFGFQFRLIAGLLLLLMLVPDMLRRLYVAFQQFGQW
jgi:flagellar biosynthetic protein FliR